ncbi:hypothetical protein PF003_g40432 [Phytophthora fragariae]|nr:hypothetical protein PF003_g40432 [Phytophthora fragariae]
MNLKNGPVSDEERGPLMLSYTPVNDAEVLLENQRKGIRQCTAVWISFLAGGLIVGSLVDSIYNAGIFLIGAAVGVFLATIRQRVLRLPHLPERPEHGTPQAIAMGLVCGLVAFMIERPAIIAAMALVDSVVLINGAPATCPARI